MIPAVRAQRRGVFKVTPGGNYDTYLASLNPQAWWKFADAAGSSTAVDSSGNNNTATVVGTVTFGEPALVGTETSALFDGSTGKLTTTAQFGSFTALSVVQWVQLDALSSSTSGGLLCNQTLAGSGFHSQIGAADTAPNYGAGFGSGSTSPATHPSVPVDSAPHLLVCTWDGSTISLSVDAGTAETAAYSAASLGQATDPFIGEYNGAGSYYWQYLAQMAVFDYALTSAQISNLYTYGT